jgi:hypothetical protein
MWGSESVRQCSVAVSDQQGVRRFPAVAGCITLTTSRVCKDRSEAQQYAVEMLMPPPGRIGNLPNEQLSSRTLSLRHRTRTHPNIDGSGDPSEKYLFNLL